jgi:TPR repeat protein
MKRKVCAGLIVPPQSRLAEARYEQGETYLWGQFGRAVDYKKALAIFRSCAEEGNANAQVNFGSIVEGRPGNEQGRGSGDSSGFAKRRRVEMPRRRAFSATLWASSTRYNARRLEALKWVMLAADQGEIHLR